MVRYTENTMKKNKQTTSSMLSREKKKAYIMVEISTREIPTLQPPRTLTLGSRPLRPISQRRKMLKIPNRQNNQYTSDL